VAIEDVGREVDEAFREEKPDDKAEDEPLDDMKVEVSEFIDEDELDDKLALVELELEIEVVVCVDEMRDDDSEE